jgi:hypothetical protein
MDGRAGEDGCEGRGGWMGGQGRMDGRQPLPSPSQVPPKSLSGPSQVPLKSLPSPFHVPLNTWARGHRGHQGRWRIQGLADKRQGEGCGQGLADERQTQGVVASNWREASARPRGGRGDWTRARTSKPLHLGINGQWRRPTTLTSGVCWRIRCLSPMMFAW